MMKLFNLITAVIAFLTMIVALITIIVVTYWLNYPYKPLEIKGEQFIVLNKTVKQGGTLFYISNYCKTTDLSARTSRAFVNGIIYTTPELTTGRESGCHLITVGISVPHELPPGPYHLENIYIYKVNPIREVIVEHKSELFNVIESE